MFHARGYDAVGVADLTAALDIKPPSLYAAYGSKLGLFERALQSYVETDFLPVGEILATDADPARALTNLFVAAARHYTRNPERRGCMITEAMRADDAEAAAVASAFGERGSKIIHDYIVAHASPEAVDRILDYVLVNLRGLSSFACLGHTAEKLVGCSEVAGGALKAEFAASAAG
nr:TetR/AcrR family transcriptional regulator [Methylopila capsulata]